MAEPKQERNREFIQDWKVKGLTDKDLMKKYKLSQGGLRGLKSRLRKKDKSLYAGKTQRKPERKQPIKEDVKIEIKEAINVDLSKDLMDEVRHYKIDSKKKLYQIVDEALRDYLEKKGRKIER